MTQALDNSANLKTLLEREPDLIDRLQKATEAGQAKTLIMESAERHDITLDTAALEQQIALAARQAEMLAQLQVLMQKDPTLEPALKQATELEAVMDLILTSAQHHGMDLDSEELQTQLQNFQLEGELSDEELEGVAGGLGMTVALSAMVAATLIGGALIGGGSVGLGYLFTKEAAKKK